LLSIADLESLLHAPGVSNQNRLLFCLALEPVRPRSVSELRATGIQAGWRDAKHVNVSLYLGRARGLAIATPDGWKLTDAGKAHVASIATIPKATVVSPVAQKLRQHVAALTDVDTRAFVEEGVRCFEEGLYRSAVVLTWVGAVSLLYDHVLKKELAAFNAEAVRRDPNWKAAKSKDDLSQMKESVFLVVLHAISVIGKSVKLELEGCLTLRNGAGHPNSLRIGEQRAAGHIEILILNVYSKF
jgi:hypothetical protein